jgi:hypothetical protein
MHRLAKPLPLETPTIIELSPENKIQVTLLDANHCVGAVMFLIEGNGKAILYTGDIRAETWWVNSIVQNPVLLPYTYGSRRLDCIYLDTTFATKSEPYREFSSKAEGIRELLEKIARYPKDTIFYFHSWTFGYENVWIALSAFLKSQIHLDPYRGRIYGSLSSLRNKLLKGSGHDIREAPALCGFMNGNHFQPGCLTSHSDVRLHSCERGTGCPVVDHDTAAKVVHIIPIITRAGGSEILELGAGGGKGDLDQKEELETGDMTDVGKLMELCEKSIDDPESLSKVLALLQRSLVDGNGNIDLGQGMQKESQGEEDNPSLQTLVSALKNNVDESDSEPQNETIRFPYSRHSSYSELCTLVDALKPRDVYPCTVDYQNWIPSLGMRNLFGNFCSANVFRHDSEMIEEYELRLERERNGKRDAETQASNGEDEEAVSPVTPKRPKLLDALVMLASGDESQAVGFVTPAQSPARREDVQATSIPGSEVPASSPPADAGEALLFPQGIQEITYQPRSVPNRLTGGLTPSISASTPLSTSAASSRQSRERRIKRRNKDIAYDAALGFGLTWADFGGLVSTRMRKDQDELEL